MDSLALHLDWSDIFAMCRQIPADSAAWDQVEDFAEVLATLAREKRDARQSHQSDFARELPDFLERRGALIGRVLPPDAGTWTPNVPDETQAALARQTLVALDAAIAEADEIARALDQARYGEHRLLQRQQAEAQERIDVGSETLTKLLRGGDAAPALPEPSPAESPSPVTPDPVPASAEPAGAGTPSPVPLPDGEFSAMVSPEQKTSSAPPPPPEAMISGEAAGTPQREEGPVAAAPDGGELPLSTLPGSEIGSPPPVAALVPSPSAVAKVRVAPAAVSLQLPPELDGYNAFRARHWIEPDGRCALAPWEDPGFEARVNQAAAAALGRHDFASLWVYSQAAQERVFVPLVEPGDVRHLASLWSDPDSPTAALSATRAESLRQAVECAEGAEPRWQMAAFLEALHPSLEQSLTPELLSGIVFGNPILGNATVALLRLNRSDSRPVQRLRAERKKTQSSTPGQLASQLAQARRTLQKLVAQQHSAAGGRIKLSHCRRAWKRFMEEAVQPLAQQLYPSDDASDHKTWTFEDLRRQALGLAELHRRFADEGEARYEGRAVMDRAADEIVRAAVGVIQLAAELRQLSPAGTPRTNGDLAALRFLLDSAPMESPVEEACRQLFARVVNGPQDAAPPQVNAPLSLSLSEVILRPWLASVFERDPLLSDGKLPPRLPLDLLAPGDTPRAAAALLTEPILRPEEIPTDEAAWPEALREALAKSNRRDLRVWFVGAEFIAEPEKTHILAEQTEMQGALESHLQELRSQWREAEALVLPFEARLKKLLDDGDRQIEDATPLQREMPLLDAWLHGLGEFLRRAIDEQCARFLAQAHRLTGDLPGRVRTAVETRRFADVLELLHGRAAGAESASHARDARETLWREDAASRWPDPMAELEEAREASVGGAGPVSDLLAHWCPPTDQNMEKRKLRAAFYDFLCGAVRQSHEAARHHNEPSRFRIDVPLLLQWLDAQGFNPTFVPQLRQFSEVVLMSPSAPPNNAQLFTNALLNAVPQGDDQRHLAIFLAPRLSRYPEARAQTILQIRRRARSAALLDDLDLCRLLAPGSRQPIGFIGLLEIVFEQMDWTGLRPFAIQDGQFIQAEMFVGRDLQAEKLATETTYSRIFSGRKLGKSALLKHLQMSRDGRKLPSGQTLRVLYLNAAGASMEASLVDTILGGLAASLRFPVPAPPAGLRPGERLAHALKAWRVEAEGDSLLVILDEADSFVESQIGEYTRSNESSLSFAMMKSIPEEARDNRGLPRVRFLLAGYRATNRDEGVWINAGEFLSLEPLPEEEAVRLIEGPLARLNIDAREQAPAIARRCGNQPAVLLRFGVTLLLHLQEHHSRFLREKVVVTSKNVADVFNSPRVQGEIRTIVDNNFHDNPLRTVIWTALLVRLRRVPPGTWLEGAAEEVLDQIKQVNPDPDWLREIHPDQTPVIATALREFRERQLICLEATDDGTLRCQMRFPHYLPVLTRDANLENTLRQNLDALRDKAQEGQSVTSLLPAQDLETIRWYFRPAGKQDSSQDLSVRVLVVGGQWPAALQHEYGGLPARLGLSSGEIFAASSLPPGARLCAARDADAGHLAAQLARGEDAAPPGPPLLLGGLGLLRAALLAEEDTGGEVLAFGLHRLTSSRLRWWFGRLRTWQFDVSGAGSRILALTSGIPLLVRVADDFLEGQVKPGAGVSADLFEELEKHLREARTGAAARLRDPVGGDGLMPRERELLKMAAVAARHTKGYPHEDVVFTLGTELGEYWEVLYSQELPGVRPLDTIVEDQLALRLLRFSGLLPLNQAGLFRARPDDALYSLAQAL